MQATDWLDAGTYLEKPGGYGDVQVSLPEADWLLVTGKVGFLSRAPEWVRVDKVR